MWRTPASAGSPRVPGVNWRPLSYSRRIEYSVKARPPGEKGAEETTTRNAALVDSFALGKEALD